MPSASRALRSHSSAATPVVAGLLGCAADPSHRGSERRLERLGIEQGFAKPQFGAVEADPIIAATPPHEAEHVADTLSMLSGAAGATKAGSDRSGLISRSHVFFLHGLVAIGAVRRRQEAGPTVQQCRNGIAIDRF